MLESLAVQYYEAKASQKNVMTSVVVVIFIPIVGKFYSHC